MSGSPFFESVLPYSLKTKYRDLIVKTVKDRTKVFGKLPKVPTKFGEKITHHVRLTPAGGFGGRGEGAKLPKSHPAQARNAEINKKRIYASCVFDKILEDMFVGGDTSWIKQFQQAMDDMRDEIAFHSDRMFFGDGTGLLGTVRDAVANSTSVVVTHPKGYLYGAHQYIRENTLLVFGTVVGGVLQNPTPRRVVSRAWDTNTIVLDQPVTLAATTGIYLGDDQGHGYNQEYDGVGSFIGNTGTSQGISSDEFTRWRSYVAASTGVWDHNEILDMVAGLTGGDLDEADLANVHLKSHPVQLRNQQKANENMVLFAPKDLNFERGWKMPTISVNGMPVRWMTSHFMPYEEIHGYRGDGAVSNFEMRAMSLDNSGGTFKWLPGTDMVACYWRGYGNLGYDNRNDLAKLTGLPVDQVYLKAIAERA